MWRKSCCTEKYIRCCWSPLLFEYRVLPYMFSMKTAKLCVTALHSRPSQGLSARWMCSWSCISAQRGKSIVPVSIFNPLIQPCFDHSCAVNCEYDCGVFCTLSWTRGKCIKHVRRNLLLHLSAISASSSHCYTVNGYKRVQNSYQAHVRSWMIIMFALLLASPSGVCNQLPCTDNA